MRLHLIALAAVLPLTACSTSDDSMARGDRYWADSNYVAALGEYRLAARQHASTDVEARVAHAYIMTGQLERARRAYDQLVKSDPGTIDQAIFDFVWLARASLQRGDRYGAARAAEAALALRPDLSIPEMALTLARYYATVSETDRSLSFYRRALESADPAVRVSLLYEMASLSEQAGDCVRALPWFERFAELSADRDSVTEARYRMGTCGLERGRQLREADQAYEALAMLDITLKLGVPHNLLDQAWFERGEALVSLGRLDDAALAFERVLELSPAGRTQLAARAQRRLDEIRGGVVP
jgi:tetratricopeptide (TPR) repeat protein